MEISYSEARRSLAELLERAARGERITIIRQGKPVAELGPRTSRPTLDLGHLRAVRESVSALQAENGVLLAREQEHLSSRS